VYICMSSSLFGTYVYVAYSNMKSYTLNASAAKIWGSEFVHCKQNNWHDMEQMVIMVTSNHDDCPARKRLFCLALYRTAGYEHETYHRSFVLFRNPPQPIYCCVVHMCVL
jgi:hypothetical protein